MLHEYNSKIDEELQIDTELSTPFWDKCPRLIENERTIAKRLGVTHQKYFITDKKNITLL